MSPDRLRRFLSLILGLGFTLVLLELGLTMAQWAFVHQQAQHNAAALSAGERPYRILCIGESTTAVAGDARNHLLIPQTAYPAQLATILAQQRPDLQVQVINNGVMGGTTQQLLSMLESSIDHYDPDMIIAMMGIKDAERDGLVGSFAWPAWLRGLKTVQLGRWAHEAVQLRRQAIVTEIDNPADLPDTLRVSSNQLSKYIRESRLADGTADPAAIEHLELATYLWFIGRHHLAEQQIRQVIATHDVGYNLLARVMMTHDRSDEAVDLMRATVASHPQEGMYQVALAEALIAAGRLSEADALVQAARPLTGSWHDESRARPRLELSWAEIARQQGTPQLALERLQQIRHVRSKPKPGDMQLFTPLPWLWQLAMGETHRALQQWDLAEHHFLKVLEQHPRHQSTMWQLALVYRAQDRLTDEATTRRSLITRSGRLAEYFELARLMRLQGHPEEIPSLIAEAAQRIPSLSQSYAHLYTIVRQHGIRLVIMQYPSFSPDLLHLYAPADPDITFIDNEHIFDADPDAYWFEARFPHSFSHYTQAGSRVLAEHLADELRPLIDAETQP